MRRSYYAAGRPVNELSTDAAPAPASSIARKDEPVGPTISELEAEATPSDAAVAASTATASLVLGPELISTGASATAPGVRPPLPPTPVLSQCERELNGQLANRTLWKALACGLIADGFAWQYGVGLNLALYLVVMLLGAASVLRLRMGGLPRSSARLLGLGGVFATLLIVRDAEELQFLNFVACLSCAVLALAVARPTPILNMWSARVRDGLGAAARSAVEAVTWALPLLFHITSRTRDHKRAALLRIVRVAALSVAVTLAFGMLLAAGDPVFRNAAQWLVNWNAGTFGTHIGTVFVFAWPVAGLLWGATSLRPTPRFGATPVMPTQGALRYADVISALVALNVLFGVFVATQARVLFGGQAYVLSTTGLSLAEYARSGFFTLIFVAGLVLSLLLAFNALLDKQGLGASRVMQRLSLSLLALTSVVLVSAGARMIVYMNAYGASSDRLFALVVMGWLGVVMAWFASTVMRHRPARFAFGSVVAAWGTLLIFNAMNPHAVIARNHLARAARGELADMKLVARDLSLDVVPVVVKAARSEMKLVQDSPIAVNTLLAGTGSRTSACGAIKPLALRMQAATNHRWSTWSLAHWRAKRALDASERELALCR